MHVDMMMFLTSCCEVDMLTLHTMYKDDTGMLVDYISLDRWGHNIVAFHLHNITWHCYAYIKHNEVTYTAA